MPRARWQLCYSLGLDRWRGIAVPRGTPRAVIDRLLDANQRTVGSAELGDAGTRLGFTPAFLPADAFTGMIAENNAQIAAVIEMMR